MGREPVVIVNAVTVLVEAAILMLVAFGLAWTPEQIAAVMGFVLAAGVIAQTLLVRSQVTPVADPKNDEGVPLEPPPIRGSL